MSRTGFRAAFMAAAFAGGFAWPMTMYGWTPNNLLIAVTNGIVITFIAWLLLILGRAVSRRIELSREST